MECDIVAPHVDSFNYLIEPGVRLAALDVAPEKFRLPSGEAIELRYTHAELGYPTLPDSDCPIYPSECRQRSLTYAAPLKASVRFMINGRHGETIDNIVIGHVPIMLKSDRCHLKKMSRSQLEKVGEEATEKGGYFVCKGSEKVIRMLIANKQNYPIALIRQRYKTKGALFTEYAIMLRSVLEMHTASLITLHYMESGNMKIAIQYQKEIFYLPFMYIFKCLSSRSDAEITETLTRCRPNDPFWRSIVLNMLTQCQQDSILHQEGALRAIGNRFRGRLEEKLGPWEDDVNCGKHLIERCVAIHLKNDEEKFYLLAYMAQKLFALSRGECAPESPDNPQFQEAALSGHIMLLTLKERMDTILRIAKLMLLKKANLKKDGQFYLTGAEIARLMGAHRKGEITRGMEYFLATGNLITKIGIGIQQNNGYSVVAERINQLRFVSHFRAIHRGAFFTEMRTTDVRKLRPETWGFICPVHTPDGSPCGLLNHVTASCRITTHYPEIDKLLAFMEKLGMYTHHTIGRVPPGIETYPVFACGRHVGFIPVGKAPVFERLLRLAKVSQKDDRVPYDAEIALVRKSPDPQSIQTQFPGVYVFTDAARLYRPVRNLITNTTEMIGPFEQVYMSIALDPKDVQPGETLHQELHPSCLFSFASNLIPFPDHNQSPRNIYQCQMGKQTMGTAIHSWQYRNDNKMYRLQFPQSPLLKTEAYNKYEMDEYPSGTNACVAVISYTGYDMEDAMVINRGSFQRGFAHGTVIKVEKVDLTKALGQEVIFYMHDEKKDLTKYIGADGLPIQGRRYFEDDPYMMTFNTAIGKPKIHKFHYAEPAYCGIVRLVENEEYPALAVEALIQWRIERNPIIGDKFASRHGQKGINSFLWPVESLPFSESGMVPDIIFNPHGFPSRMTIGMMIESMAGKGASMQGTNYDASPFVFSEENTAINHFGSLLQKSGYNYYGEETMYSGVDGREFTVQIFFGIVYYQRLRHMIADKFQVRATGPIDPVTHQPVKGRKKGGGIRFGEMERDAIIAHGAAFVLQDRLLNCSDRDVVHICRSCGSLLSVLVASLAIRKKLAANQGKTYRSVNDLTDRPLCKSCGKDDDVHLVQIPHVFRFLVAELAAMNVKLVLDSLDGIKGMTKVLSERMKFGRAKGNGIGVPVEFGARFSDWTNS
ncbi:unnamed protein product, partial [Mesorhabditis belari]|uniref:DNA-directed RNA polymerase subunit beta n=1 Tax=Mesorhabditis belari TaxID=2138241 RepID=A0AAF3ECZ7_9BILA